MRCMEVYYIYIHREREVYTLYDMSRWMRMYGIHECVYGTTVKREVKNMYDNSPGYGS